jgi:hypothetical protein
VQPTTDFPVSWAGTDTGSGISEFTIFVSTNGGPFTEWLTTAATSAIFQGQPATTYAFYSRARDRAGNREAAKSVAEATTTTPAGEPCTITCPANIVAVTSQPGAACETVNYAAPVLSGNCSGVTVACSPPSGSCFPLGVTTVNCTATDASGNTAQCSFTVTVFDICLQDDSNATTAILINSATGDYRFCCGGTVFTGRGDVRIKGQVYTLEHNASDRRVRASVDTGQGKGNASIQSPPGSIRCTITDRNTRGNSCPCRN